MDSHLFFLKTLLLVFHLLDIRENVEWPHFFWPTLYVCMYEVIIIA